MHSIKLGANMINFCSLSHIPISIVALPVTVRQNLFIRFYHSSHASMAKKFDFSKKVALLEAQLTTTLPGTTSDTSLIEAVRNKDSKAIAAISKAKPDLVRRQTRDDNTPLHEAARLGDVSMMIELFKANPGLNPNRRCHCLKERVPIHYSAENGHYETSEVLFEHKADPNIRDEEGRTALDYALEFKHTEVAKLIYSYGGRANLRKKEEKQFTTEYIAKKYAESLQPVKIAADAQFSSFLEELKKNK